MSNFKSAAKRKRELAKLDKRQAKDQKRALRKSERAGAAADASPATGLTTVQRTVANNLPAHGTTPAPRPMTLAEAVERWKKTPVVKPKRRS
jgi:hypothetical protein